MGVVLEYGPPAHHGRLDAACDFSDDQDDTNDDMCPDGFEDPAACPCVAAGNCPSDPDDNAATGILRRFFSVERDDCTPLTVSDLDPNSLRLVKLTTDDTQFSWRRLNFNPIDPGRSFNIHLIGTKSQLRQPDVLTAVPAWRRVEANLEEITLVEQVPQLSGPITYIPVFQNDGCASGWSLADP